MRESWIWRRFTRNHWSGFGDTETSKCPHLLTMDGATWLFGTTGVIGVALRGEFSDAPRMPAETETRVTRFLTHAGSPVEVVVADMKAYAGAPSWDDDIDYRDAKLYGSVLDVHLNKLVLARLLDGIDDEMVLVSAASRLEKKGRPDTLMLSALDDSWRAVLAGVRRQETLLGGIFEIAAAAGR